MIYRNRRLRENPILRNMVKEVELSADELIYPLFIVEGEGIVQEISSMPGQFRYSVDSVLLKLEEILALGIKSVILFGIPDTKDEMGRGAYDDNGIVQKALRAIKSKFGSRIFVVTDVCMCEYTSHGHCGIVKGTIVDNDTTITYMGAVALSHAKAGADMVAPSDMMDGRIGFIRETLDKNGFSHIPVMAYSAKYASSFYGPFREAADSAPGFGDRKGYQMDYMRKSEAEAEVLQDIEEGADIVMVKPAMSYLDIVKSVKDKIRVPLAVYNVSGEYAMIKAAAQNGWIDEIGAVCEMLYSMKRAGADIIITYHALDFAGWRKDGLI